MMKNVKRNFFRLLARANKALLPKVYKLDMNNLSRWDKALIGYKYWVTKNSLKD